MGEKLLSRKEGTVRMVPHMRPTTRQSRSSQAAKLNNARQWESERGYSSPYYIYMRSLAEIIYISALKNKYMS